MQHTEKSKFHLNALQKDGLYCHYITLHFEKQLAKLPLTMSVSTTQDNLTYK